MMPNREKYGFFVLTPLAMLDKITNPEIKRALRTV